MAQKPEYPLILLMLKAAGVLSKFIMGFISYQGYETNFYQQILRGYQSETTSGLGDADFIFVARGDRLKIIIHYMTLKGLKQLYM